VRKQSVLKSPTDNGAFLFIHLLKKIFMDDIRTFFSFQNGEIAEQARYDCDNQVASTVETIKCFLSELIEKHQLSGKVFIEVKDGIHFVDYEVVPKQYEQLLKQELDKKCFVFERAEFMEEEIAEHTHIM